MLEQFLVPQGWTRIGQEAFARNRGRVSTTRAVIVFGGLFGVVRSVMNGEDFPSVLESLLIVVVVVAVVSMLANVALLLLSPGIRVADDGSVMKAGWATMRADALRAAVLETSPGGAFLRLGAYPGNGPRLLLRLKDRATMGVQEREVLVRLLERSAVQPPDIIRAEQPPGARREVRGLISKEAAIAAVRELEPPMTDEAEAGQVRST